MKHLPLASLLLTFGLFITSCGDQKKQTKTVEEAPEIVAQEQTVPEPPTEAHTEIVNMSAEEYSALISSQPFVVVDFYATWCRPCIQMAPHLKKIAEGYDDNQFKLVKIDAEKNVQLSTAENITAYPTLKIYKDGKELKTHLGGLEEVQLRELFAPYM